MRASNNIVIYNYPYIVLLLCNTQLGKVNDVT